MARNVMDAARRVTSWIDRHNAMLQAVAKADRVGGNRLHASNVRWKAAWTFGPGSKQIVDPIRRIAVSNSVFNVATATTSAFPFGDQIQAVQSLTLTNVVRSGVHVPDNTYTAP